MTETTFIFEYLAIAFLWAVGIIILILAVLFIIDVSQTSNAVRRNYPVLGRFRSLFTKMGEFFRQYFFAMDREELPFNRAQRNWVLQCFYECRNNLGHLVQRKIWIIRGIIFLLTALFLPWKKIPPQPKLFRLVLIVTSRI